MPSGIVNFNKENFETFVTISSAIYSSFISADQDENDDNRSAKNSIIGSTVSVNCTCLSRFNNATCHVF